MVCWFLSVCWLLVGNGSLLVCWLVFCWLFDGLLLIVFVGYWLFVGCLLVMVVCWFFGSWWFVGF